MVVALGGLYRTLFILGNQLCGLQGSTSSSPSQSQFSMASNPSTRIIKPSAKHTATVIFMHGLGDTADGWFPVMQEIKAPHIKYIVPTANTIPVTLNMGMRMPAWFDIIGLAPNSGEDEASIKAAAAKVHGWINAEIAGGIASERILLGGFSQGGALSLYSTFTFPKPLGGVVALSSWLPLHKTVAKVMHAANKEVHVLQAQGEADPLVIPVVAETTNKMMKAFNPNVQYKSYPGLAHSANQQEIDDIKAFIAKRLP